MSNEELLQKIREEIAASEKHEHPCPNCGRCPTCGRGAAPVYPTYPWGTPYPHWQYIPFTTTYGTGDSIRIGDNGGDWTTTTATFKNVPVTLT